MADRFHNELPPAMAAHVEAMRDPAPADVQRAQRRLTARLEAGHRSDPRAHGIRPARVRWMATAAMVAVAAVLLIALPLLPGGSGAFAAVQAHFREFDTLSMRVEQRMDGRLVQTSRMLLDRRGVLRTDVGNVSVIVDPVQGRVLTLQHGPRRATVTPLPVQGPAAVRPALAWLDELRDYRGRAVPAEGTRIIGGRRAQGWRLELAGAPMVLWADAQGRPLALETAAAGGLQIRYRFEFDVPVPTGYLDSNVPNGYERVAAG